MGYDVVAQNMDEKETRPFGVSDAAGDVTVSPGKSAVQMLYVKSDGLTLAALPVVPGVEDRVEVWLPDDDMRLRAAARLGGAAGRYRRPRGAADDFHGPRAAANRGTRIWKTPESCSIRSTSCRGKRNTISRSTAKRRSCDRKTCRCSGGSTGYSPKRGRRWASSWTRNRSARCTKNCGRPRSAGRRPQTRRQGAGRQGDRLTRACRRALRENVRQRGEECGDQHGQRDAEPEPGLPAAHGCFRLRACARRRLPLVRNTCLPCRRKSAPCLAKSGSGSRSATAIDSS